MSDLRTNLKTSDVNRVLDGEFDDFTLAYLREEESKKAWEGDEGVFQG